MQAASAEGTKARSKATSVAPARVLRVRAILNARETYRMHAMEGSRQVIDKRRVTFRRARCWIFLALACSLFSASASGSNVISQPPEMEAHAFTDGHLRPGHRETIRVKGFPGHGRTEVSFFPTAICGRECAGFSRRGARTDSDGSAKFSVRMPGTFIGQNHKHAYFRDGERIDVNIVWYGSKEAFATAFVRPAPIIVRTHRSQH
jgi:hypothetical protein